MSADSDNLVPSQSQDRSVRFRIPVEIVIGME